MPGFTLHRAARIEALAESLATRIRTELPPDPFSPVTIAVGSRGMERWLRNRLAVELGISANLAFPFPQQALSEVYGEQSGRRDPWEPDSLAWRVAAALPGLLEDPMFAPLRTWLTRPGGRALGSSPLSVSRDLWSLSREVADVLDRAALFRPEWTRAWEAGTTVSDAPAWQGALWRVLARAIETPHPTRTLEGAPRPGDALHVFAVSSMPPTWLSALARAGTRRSVHVYLLTPSKEYWGDLRTARELARLRPDEARDALDSQNPLLTAYGALARDAAEAYLQLPYVSEPDLAGAFEVSDASSALGTLQADIIAARARADLVAERDAHPLCPDDDSVQFHACHGPTRQVEALREALLELFDRHPDLQPRDVVVMTPDLGTYAPLVRAVFAEGNDTPGKDGWGPVGAPRIATYIADLGTRELNPLADVLMRALELVDGRVTAPALADFVALDPVRRRFGFDDADIARIRVWLNEAGARVGVDAEDRERSGLPPQYAFTLAFALDRLALGMTQADDGVVSFHGVAPFDEMEGDAARSFGPFAELCARLEGWRRRFRVPRPMDAWARELGELVDDLAAMSAKAGFLRRELLDGLAALKEEASSFDGSVSADAITAMLDARFEHGKGGDRLTTGGVTVCALAPMRSVPFRVVCLLGMDDGTFPRIHHPRAFDAVGMHPRRGDRDPREEDRNLLLEALLATRAHLLVFYTGRDPRTDKVLAPAVPIGDLLDAVDITFTHPVMPDVPARTRLTRTHAVQPFASGGFRRDGAEAHAPRPRRYDTRMHAAAMAFARSREGLPAFVSPTDLLPEGTPPVAYTIESLARWVRTPVRTLARERLGLYLDAHTTELPDRESFELDTLENWVIGNAAATAWMRGADDGRRVIDRLSLRGALPPGAPGRAAGRRLWTQTMTAAAALRRLYDGPLPARVRREVRVEVPAAHGAVVVTGSTYAYGDALLRFGHDGPNDSKTLLPAWVLLVAVRAAGHEITRMHLVGAVKTKGVTVTLQVPSVEQARAHLTDLVALALEARTRPLPLVQKTSFAWADKAVKASTDDVTDDARRKLLEQARTAARGKWDAASAGSPPGEAEDPTLALVFGPTPPYGPDRNRFSPEFEALATRLWSPILSARSTR